MNAMSTAPGKLMLFGEHAVIYGYPSIVTAIDSRLTATVARDTQADVISSPQVSDTRFVTRALQQFRTTYRIQDPVRIDTRSEFSHTFGFGSSSAVTVAVLQSLCSAFDIAPSKKELFHMAYDTVLAVQGSGSGFDVAAAVYGGTLYFIAGGTRIDRLSLPELPLVIVYSGVKADTATYVAGVKARYDQDPKKITRIFTQIQEVTESGMQSLTDRNMRNAGVSMSRNHELLCQLGVSTPVLDRLVETACNAGAYGAKLSGAGGGDCIIALVPEEKRQKIETSVTAVGGQVLHVRSNAEGVRTHIS